ncbi:MAG: helix-hairpin-helix domain-containing protein [Verrucomicrobiota bacterium]
MSIARINLRCLLSALLQLLLVLNLWTGAQAAELRVLSLNAQWFPGRTPRPSRAQRVRHIKDVQHLLAKVNPDVWLVQEVQDRAALKKALRVLPDMKIHVYTKFHSGLQLAIASRLKPLAAGYEEWGRSKPDPPRGYAFCVFDTGGKGRLAVYNVHFKSNYAGPGADTTESENIAMRESSARQLTFHLSDIKSQFVAGATVLIGGDFNVAYPRSLYKRERTVKILRDAGLEWQGGGGYDHFFGKGSLSAKARSLREYDLSDHDPILCVANLPGKAEIARARPLTLKEAAADLGTGLTDINTADQSELESLPMIGPVKARRIIEGRPYKKTRDLLKVKGIGPAILDKIMDSITVITADPT